MATWYLVPGHIAAFGTKDCMMAASDSDDGFQDFLSDEEEHETLLAQESVALERRMKTVGIRDGLERGKEDTLQQGFDLGFTLGATRSSGFARLRGALSTARACRLFPAAAMDEDVASCILQLRKLEMDTSVEEEHKEEAEKAVHKARELLAAVGIEESS